jgi:mannose-6-phosphate isomerase-like protein (cupin superfamily)
MKLLVGIALALLTVPAVAQSAGKVEVFSSGDMHTQFAKLADQAKARGLAASTLGDYGGLSLRLAVRVKDGGAEVHAHFDDVILVTDGKATLVTGGAVVDGHTNSNGETLGSGIQNGSSQPISAGDIVHIPAGIPHQMLIAPGVTFTYVLMKVKPQP